MEFSRQALIVARYSRVAMLFGTGETERRELLLTCGVEQVERSKAERSFKTKSENPREFSDLERKKEAADMKSSRHLRKPGRRNEAAFF